MVAARGALGRKIDLLRSWGLDVTRLGNNPGPDFDEAFWQRLTVARSATN